MTSSFKKFHYLFLIAIIITLVCVQAHAMIIVSELKPFRLGKWSLGSGDIVADQDICVAMLPQGPYSITVSGDSQNKQFVLRSGFDTIAYRLFFNDRPRLGGRVELTPGVALTGLRGRRLKRRAPCNRLTANLSLLIPEANIASAPAGVYSSNIVLLVSPE